MRWLKSVFRLFTSRRMVMVVLSGFSSGLPLSLTASTMQAWMKESGVDLTTIGAFALVGLPYSLKFLWAPFMDRFVPPWLGRRRGWMVATQVALMLGIAAMGLGSSQAVRYFILKAIAFEMGRRLSGRASVREGWVSHKKAGDGASR